MDLLHKYIDEQEKPQDFLKPLAAAIMAECMIKPSREDFNFEFEKDATPTSYNRYVKEHKDTDNPYANDFAFNGMVKEFKKI